MDQQLIEKLKQPLSDFMNELKQDLLSTTSNEIAIKHTENNNGIHVRDDSVEIFAGETSIIIDSNTNSIILNGNHLISLTSDTNFVQSNSDSFGIDGFSLNSEWYNYLGLPDTAPITFREFFGGTNTFITGQPSTGQYSRSFSEVFDAKQLFNIQILKDYLSDLNSILGEIV